MRENGKETGINLLCIRSGLFAFSMPKEKVLDYTDTVARIELVKGRASTPAKRLEEFIEKELNWDAGDDPVAQFNIRARLRPMVKKLLFIVFFSLLKCRESLGSDGSLPYYRA